MKKSKTRLFINKKLSSDMIVDIKDKQFHLLKNVLRCKINDEIILFDNQTGEWCSNILGIDKSSISLQISKKNKNLINEADIWLAFAPIKLHRLNITIQKSTELGVSKFIPCITNFTNNSFLNYKNLNLNIIEAAEQCERLTLPSIEKQMSISDLIKNHPKDRALIFCNEHFQGKENMFSMINKEKKNYKKWTLLIGPEGGFSQDECNELEKMSSIISVSLGRRILRSDTAAMVALYCLQSIIDN